MVVPLANPSADGWSCMFWTYALYNRYRNKIYIGQTQNLDQRVKRHKGELIHDHTSFTARNSGKWLLVYTEEFHTRSEAILREKELKTQKGREFIWNIVN